MTDFVSVVVKEVLGPGHLVEDSNPVPTPFRGIPIANGGVPPTTPAGARVWPTGINVSTIPKPR